MAAICVGFGQVVSAKAVAMTILELLAAVSRKKEEMELSLITI